MKPADSETNDDSDVFLRDHTTGEVRLISRNEAGTDAADGASYQPVISEDGRRVFFISEAINLVTQPDNNDDLPDLFVYDVAIETITLLSYNSDRDGTPFVDCVPEGGTGGVNAVRANVTGTVVPFLSDQPDLTRLPDDNCDQDVFVRRLAP